MNFFATNTFLQKYIVASYHNLSGRNYFFGEEIKNYILINMSNLINHVIRRTMSSGGVINHVTIIGAGLMGSGIAQVFR